MLFAEEKQNIGGLPQRHFSGHQIRRRKRRMLAGRLHVVDQRAFVGARIAGAFPIRNTARFQRQAHEFSPPGNAIPIPKVVGHTVSFQLVQPNLQSAVGTAR